MYKTLQNIHLDETPIPSSTYNGLPHIDFMRDAANNHLQARTKLLNLIASHGVSHIFSVHLLHKHFDLPEGRVMVYELVSGRGHPDFVLCSPRCPSSARGLRGLYFRALPSGQMVAYEYTTERGEDLSRYEDFVKIFGQAVVEMNVRDVFSLTVKPLHTGVLTEFEMSDFLSTVLVHEHNSDLISLTSAGQSTVTDWLATTGDASDLDITSDKSASKTSMNCTSTRSGKHYNFVDCEHGEGQPRWCLAGVPLETHSEAYALLSKAQHMIDAF